MESRQKLNILLHSNNIWNFGDGLFGPLFAVFAQKIGGNILDVTWAWAVYLAASGVFTILMGKVSDKYSKEKLMILGYALTALMSFCYVFASEPIHLMIIQIGLGFALAICNPTWYALYSKHAQESGNDGFMWGLSDGTSRLCIAIAITIGGYLVENFSFTILFILMGTIQVISTLLLLTILDFGKEVIVVEDLAVETIEA
jgi:MFS family permease